jgi:hypothetical protein
MNILAVGDFHNCGFVDCARFGSDVSFLSYDVVILDFTAAFREYTASYLSQEPYGGEALLDEKGSTQLRKDFDRRRAEILEMLGLGRSVVVLICGPQTCYVQDSEDFLDLEPEKVDLLSVLPVEVDTEEGSGSRIEFLGHEAFAILWDAYGDQLCHRGYFVEEMGTPVFRIKGTDKAIGAYVKHGKGNMIFLPSLKEESQDQETKERFFCCIAEVVETMNAEEDSFALPSWSSEYSLPDESASRLRLSELERERTELDAKIQEQAMAISKLEEWKLLFTSTGEALERQVRKTFQELGFDIEDTESGRSDLAMKYGDRIAVVEVKGVTGSAAEKHAAQLEKWVSEYYASTGKEPKGILVVNAFRHIPLQNRDETVFPDQMLPYCEQREHCLLTGLQLLDLYLACMDEPSEADDIINTIFETKGVFCGYDDWGSFCQWPFENPLFWP